MQQEQKNKEFIIRYGQAINGQAKTRALIEEYVTDEALIEHIVFFESVFPKYELVIDEIIAEGNRVTMRARFRGKHEGEFNGIPPTGKSVEMQFAIGYEIENEKIVSHWLIADQLTLLEQLGVSAAEPAH